MLWNCLKEQMVSTDMQDFANDLYACSLEHNVGEDLTDTQEVFFKKHFGDSKKSTYRRCTIRQLYQIVQVSQHPGVVWVLEHMR